jgi:CheY-like chemotaxis protein
LARKILLADDSVTAQNMGRRILSDAGYDVTTVNNGSAALKKIAESKPDLIVLDVYMPGYGGLEVCQRLREAPETARIPVLLTVGKLEPFKADEARRVRADAFIVKPFEASELLTALTKLEDKIVPQSQPSRQSRFAKALAGVEEPNPSKEFGDSETGWKNRLSIPPPQSKHRDPVPQEPSAAVLTFREAVRAEEPKPAEMEIKSGIEEALLSSMPQDVTAEEIAAIKAAAAAFSAPGNESSFMPARDPADAAQEAVGRTEQPVSEFVASDSFPATAQAEPVVAAAGDAKLAEAAADVPAETVPPAATIVSEADTTTSPQLVNEETGKLAVDEVTAALASLAPANGHSSAADREADKWEVGARDQVPVTMAVAGAIQEFSGPRWIAESVAVMDDEATLVLEQEMEKAYAAFAAADASRMSFTGPPADAAYASSPVTEIPEASSETVSTPVESFSNSESAEPQPQNPAVHPSDEEPAPAQPELSAEPSSPIIDAVSESAVPEVKESAAYAAAASAGASIPEATINAEVSSPPNPAMESSESVPPASEPSGRQGESELAAAWANWKQVRESVIGSQLSSQIAETVVELKEKSSDEQPQSQVDVAAASGEEATDIANIVDSVLADLKPKLMAEIARKMAKDPKKK